MKQILAVLLFGISINVSNNVAYGQQGGVEKTIFYRAMRGNDEDAIKKQLDVLKTDSGPQKTAFEGALMMKLAGIVGGLKKKLDLFRNGHSLLESVLEKDSSNTEYRFLRLMIQEHAPGILGYKGALAKDKEYIRTHYRNLPANVQDAILDYSKQSKVLKSAELL